MKFKKEYMKDQYLTIPALLNIIVLDFEFLSRRFAIEPTVTRVFDAVKGESGVHSDNRAIDIRNEFKGVFTYTKDQSLALVHYINARYIRLDSKKTIIHHSFNEGPCHFHIQIPSSPHSLRFQKS